MMAGETQWVAEKSMGDGECNGGIGMAVASGLGARGMVAVALCSVACWIFLHLLHHEVKVEAPCLNGRQAASADQLWIR